MKAQSRARMCVIRYARLTFLVDGIKLLGNLFDESKVEKLVVLISVTVLIKSVFF